MTDFPKRLISRVQKLRGVSDVHFRPRGKGRLRRHPALTIVLINGKGFDFPLRNRPRDACRDYFLSYLFGIRRRVRALLPSSTVSDLEQTQSGPDPHHHY